MSKYDESLKKIMKEIEILKANGIEKDEDFPVKIIYNLARLHMYLSQYFGKNRDNIKTNGQ